MDPSPGPDRIGPAFPFLTAVTAYHVLTYFAAGMAAAAVFRYDELFRMPVIRDYYNPVNSTSVLLGLALQAARGAVFGGVLLPLRGFLEKSRYGWLWLWLLFVGIGILGTPAASPGSLEGVAYTKLPLWFHLIGLPEILLQTLAFSFLVHRRLRAPEHPLPAAARMLARAAAVACVSFLGYTAVSLAFAFSSGAGIPEGGPDVRVLGQFAAPLLLTFGVTALARDRWWVPRHGLLYLASSASLGVYQAVVLGGVGWSYVLSAPVLPSVIALVLTRPARRDRKTI